METLKRFEDHVTDAMVEVEVNGEKLQKPLIVSGLLRKDADSEPLFMLHGDFVAEKDNILAQFPGYHIITKAEVEAVKALLTTWYNNDGSPKETRDILGWKDWHDIPGGYTGPDYVSIIMGIDYLGFGVIGSDGEISMTSEGTEVKFMLDDGDDNSGIVTYGYTNVKSGFSTARIFGGGVTSVMMNVLLVKDYE